MDLEGGELVLLWGCWTLVGGAVGALEGCTAVLEELETVETVDV